ncbi:MAG TPA: N-acetylmuramoyl-L-alanine amidase [Crocinitomicaceae bacterium]|nr:N-acetylmuramoyl-L-alanine amidase [Crocinitomicaceae bacterium]
MRIILFLVISILTYSANCQTSKTVKVVIDAGHGGSDHGNLAHSSQLLSEKELNLKIAFFLGGYIEKYLQNVEVIYTRTKDVYPSLDERVKKANANHADYFISIHCNHSERKTVRGTETHVHSMHLSKSVAFAKEIEKQFSARAGRKSRGVKDMNDLQHTLQVLKYTNMTSVLVECGFMSNAKEARYLNTVYGQEIIASAIFRGFRSTIEKEFPQVSFKRKKGQPQETSGSYSIQIMSSIRAVDEKDPVFNSLKMSVIRTKLKTTRKYKYIYKVGSYATRKDAKSGLKKVRNRGYKDAFIVSN